MCVLVIPIVFYELVHKYYRHQGAGQEMRTSTEDASLFILLIMTKAHFSSTYDITEEGRRIILLSDIETVLINTRVSNIATMLDHLKQEAANIRTSALTDHVSNRLGKGKRRQNKLISTSVLSLMKQIETVKSDFDQFFKDKIDLESKNKRAIEILGSFLSTMAGVPSARDHRRALEQIRLLKLDSCELKSLMQRQNAVNNKILQTFHYQQNELHNFTEKLGKLSIRTHENADAIEKMMVMLSISMKINAALELARITIAHMRAIMASDKHSHLSKFVITTSQLWEIIDSIYLKRNNPFPSATEIMQSIPEDAKYFAKLDAVHGYFQLALDEESSYLTTFLIPSGRYRYLRAPMGLSSSSNEWCRYSDFVIEGCEFAKKI